MYVCFNFLWRANSQITDLTATLPFYYANVLFKCLQIYKIDPSSGKNHKDTVTLFTEIIAQSMITKQCFESAHQYTLSP